MLKHYQAVYTVSDMLKDHIGLLTNANGYTVHKYGAMRGNHIDATLGRANAEEASLAVHSCERSSRLYEGESS
ncbi:hypothetical protein GCM10027404_30550 [Arthrobacter tumbae]